MEDITGKKRQIEKAMDEGQTIVVAGKCEVKYQGRAASKLSEGDRLLIIKQDGTFLVHQSKKMNAINYQGPGAKVIVEENEKKLLITAQRMKPMKESIEVNFSEVYGISAYFLKDDEKLKLFGTERELSDLLMQDLGVIERDLIPLKQESDIRHGTIDILAEDSGKNLVIVEVKRREASLDSISQLNRYVNELRERRNRKVRGIICAPSITENALRMLERLGLEYFKLDYEIANPSARIKGLQKKQRTLDSYEKPTS